MDKKVNEYIKKQKSPQKEICKKLQKIFLKTFPKTEEKMKWGVPTYENGKYYIVALKDHVNLGFSVNGLSKKDMNLFEGNGKLMRHLKFYSLKDINEKKIIKLLKLVKNKSKDCISCKS